VLVLLRHISVGGWVLVVFLSVQELWNGVIGQRAARAPARLPARTFVFHPLKPSPCPVLSFVAVVGVFDNHTLPTPHCSRVFGLGFPTIERALLLLLPLFSLSSGSRFVDRLDVCRATAVYHIGWDRRPLRCPLFSRLQSSNYALVSSGGKLLSAGLGTVLSSTA
jgi:hypothetical protein